MYNALGQAYDFALVADERPEEFQELLIDSGLSVQDRAQMTPVVKLVFGIDYDKTRLAEYAAALNFGRRHQLGRGEMTAFLQQYSGGLKGIVKAERAERRPEASDAPKAESLAAAKARKMEPKAIIQIASEEEFVILIARRVDQDHVAVLGKSDHDAALVERALRRLNT